MKNENTKRFVTTLIISTFLVSAGAWVASNALAATDSTQKTFSQRLAEKLSLDKSKVETAMDQIQNDRQAERKAIISSKLDKAVSDGVITGDQKQKLLDKMTEIEKQRQEQRTALDKWKTESGIDFEKLGEYGVGGIGMGPGGMGGHGHGRMRMMD